MIQTLKQFTGGTLLFDAVSALLAKLNIEFDRETAEPIDVADLYDGVMPQYLKDALQNIEDTYFIGIVNDQSLAGAKSADSLDNVAETMRRGDKYDGMFIFACDAKPNANLTRTAASALTRAFNRIASANPVILIIRQGNLLSLASCERMGYSQTWRQGAGEKLGKVTMLRNINCANLHAGHRQILEKVADDVMGSTTFKALYDEWMKSFSIDVLSDAFFDGYKAIYEDIIEYVTGKRMVKEGSKWIEKNNNPPSAEIMAEFAAFEDPEKAVRDYVKKLMGRLVFIQFLQKKGWMGVPAGNSWEGGDPEFMQQLFASSALKDTFVDDVLEPLFNDLNTKRHDDLVTNQNVGTGIKVPYLNGGLFEFDKADDARFPLPSRFLQALFDFFASYNFTIDENAPDDVEIGVDPEMLGRIFENLLEDNKEKGAFYTPKEIVRYMCRESLIAYLTTCVMKKQGIDHKPEDEISSAVRRLLENPEAIVPKMSKEHLEDFGRYIRDVKICDPAIGSGAFPMGLLNELVRCRVSIGAWAKDTDTEELLVGDYAALKADIISNNIYGVDIEKGAIDIARLRFWLSIIVDLKVPHALPNFDYKFMEGNSLITTFNGEYVNLDTKEQKHIKVEEMKAEKVKLYGLKQKFYGSQGERKHKLAVEIKKCILRLVSMQLGYEMRAWFDKNVAQLTFDFDGDSNTMDFSDIKKKLPKDKQALVEHAQELYKDLNDESIDMAKRAQIDIKFFDWRMMFTEVFDNEDPGFDIVIGNPPYISAVTMARSEEEKLLYRKQYPEAKGAYDMYILFLLLGANMSKSTYCWIIPNKLLVADYGKECLERLISEEGLSKSVDVSIYDVFKTASVYPIIILGNKQQREGFGKYYLSHYADLLSNKLIKKEDVSDSIIKLEDLGVKVCSGATGFEAQKIKDNVMNEVVPNSIPFTVSGNIDRYTFNNHGVRYMKSRYEDAHVILDEKISYGKQQMWNNPKIVVAGMTKCIEAVYADEPLGIGVGAYAIYDFNGIDPYYLLGVLNAKITTQLLIKEFSDKHLAGGYLAINKSTIEQFRFPNCTDKQIQEEIASKAKKISIMKKENLLADTSSIEDEIDNLVESLYKI